MKTEEEVLIDLVDGFILEFDEDGQGARIVKNAGTITSTVLNRLTEKGLIEHFVSGTGAKLSDKGKLEYLRSTR